MISHISLIIAKYYINYSLIGSHLRAIFLNKFLSYNILVLAFKATEKINTHQNRYLDNHKQQVNLSDDSTSH